MRRLMWFALGFAVSCGLRVWLPVDVRVVPLCASLALIFLALVLFGRELKPARKAAWALLGCILGVGWYSVFYGQYLSQAVSWDGTTQETVITATEYGWDTKYGTASDGVLELGGKSYRLRFYINENQEIAPGDQFRGEFRFRVTTSDGADEATHHSGKGMFLLAYQRGEIRFDPAEGEDIRHLPARLRRGIQNILQTCFPEDTEAFARALLLGDSTGLDYETETDFRISGIRHIIAVSGLHVSILYGLVSAVTFKRRYLTAIVGIPVLALFAAVAGFTPSVTRACIMVGLMMMATALNKEYDGPTELAFASLVMLLVNPLTITSVSFQLSVASVAGILLFSPSILEWMKKRLGPGKGKSMKDRLIRWFSSSVSVTLGAVSLTTPLCAYYFGAVSLIGVLTNLLTLWAVSFIFYGIMAVCLLSLLSTACAKLLAGGVAWLIRYVLTAAKLCAKVPLAAVYTQSIYIVIWLIFVYLLLAAFLLMKQKRPAQLLCCGILGLCVALLCSWAEPLTDTCRVTVLDVGQGQSILLQSEGRTYLVDCGGDTGDEAADLVADTLLSQGITQLDGVILTHYDDDHAGGVSQLLTRIDTDYLFLPDVRNDGIAQSLAAATQGQPVWVWDDLVLTYGDTKLTIFGPIYSGSGNENSLCILFESGNYAILITGDRSAFGERMLLREAELPRVDLLIAGHHGSKSSTSEELLEALRPYTVAISVGENTFGHPSAEVLERLEKYGCTVYRTDENGTIIFRR